MPVIEQISEVMILLACVGCGVVGGIFFAFSCFVMHALSRLPPAQGIAAMQVINVVVINPLFLGVFFGTGVVCVLALIVTFFFPDGPRVGWLELGTACYLIGTLGVTLACNVPKNHRLASLEPHADDARTYWEAYVETWGFWNHIRTVAAIAAAVLFGIALS